MDDIICSGSLGPRVLDVKPMDDYKLLLTFTNGERRLFDAKPLLKMPVFKRLENESVFRLVTVDYGTVIWPHGIDYCPDTLY